MPNPIVSAVIPAYQRAGKTQRAINSVTGQTYPKLELAVVDDGSDPPLSDRLNLPGSARLIRLDENRGANVARNTGIEHASGEYIAFLDSDDEWQPEKIERQIAALKDSSGRAAYTSVEQLDANGNLNAVTRASHSGDLREQLLTGNEIGTFSSFVIETDAIDEGGAPDPDLPCWQDWEWYLRLTETIEFVALDEPLVRRHNEGDQISRSFAPKRDSAYPALRDRLKSVTRTEQEKETALAYLNYELGYAALCNHEYQTARSLFLKAIQKRPLTPQFYPYLAVSGPQYSLARQLKRKVVRGVQP